MDEIDLRDALHYIYNLVEVRAKDEHYKDDYRVLADFVEDVELKRRDVI